MNIADLGYGIAVADPAEVIAGVGGNLGYFSHLIADLARKRRIIYAFNLLGDYKKQSPETVEVEFRRVFKTTLSKMEVELLRSWLARLTAIRFPRLE